MPTTRCLPLGTTWSTWRSSSAQSALDLEPFTGAAETDVYINIQHTPEEIEDSLESIGPGSWLS